jgi:large subunit ribosomal protein L30
MDKKTLSVQLFKSPIGTKSTHKETLRGLGLKKVNSIRILEDTPCVRGMINKVSYMVKVL